MAIGKKIVSAAFMAFALLAVLGGKVGAAQCGNGSGGFETWKQEFAAEARGKGIGASAIAALMQTNYASATISADRSQRGNQNMLSSIASLAYDCRRPEFFTEQLTAALKLVDRGVLSGATRGSMHGEVGQTQFMPKNILAYGTGNLDVAANALNSTANFLRAHGWRAGAGYQPGEPNFAAIEAWNAAGVYQKAIAIMGRQIDGE